MIEKNVKFKKVLMEGNQLKSSEEMSGKIMDKFTDSRVKDNKLVNTDYYLIADQSGTLHQVRPFNIISIIQ